MLSYLSIKVVQLGGKDGSEDINDQSSSYPLHALIMKLFSLDLLCLLTSSQLALKNDELRSGLARHLRLTALLISIESSLLRVNRKNATLNASRDLR